MMEFFGYAAALLVGLVLGLLGGGGSILCIPILVYLFNLDPVMASAYSLFTVGITSLIGAIPKYRQQLMSLRTGILFGIPSIIGIFITRKWIVPAIPAVLWESEHFVLSKRILILGIFALLMVLASFSMIWGKREEDIPEQKFKTALLILQGLFIGFLTGLVGAGGGFLIIPALIFLTGLNFKIAVGTSLFIIAINSLSGFMGDVFNYAIDWYFLLLFTALAVAGIFLGNMVAAKISSIRLRKSFGWLTLLMGLWILIKEIIL